MDAEVKKIDKLKRRIKVVVEGEELLNEQREIYQRVGKGLKVAGFRPGNAPLEILKKYHGRFLKEEFLRLTLPRYYEQALKINKLVATIQPRIYDIAFEEGCLSFFAEVDVEPVIIVKENDYKGIKVKDKEVQVKEEEIDKSLAGLKEEIRKAVDIDLDEEAIAKWLGYPNLDRLRQALREDLFVDKFIERKKSIKAQVIQHLLSNIKVDISQSEADDYLQGLINREVYNLRLRGVPGEEIDKHKKDIKEKLKPVAEEQIKLSYITKAIAEKESIKEKGDINMVEIILGFILSQAQYVMT